MSTMFLLLVLIPFVGFPLLTLIVTYREKKYVRFLQPQGQNAESATPLSDPDNPYLPPSTLDDALPISPFALRVNSELDALGYRFLGDYRHAKGGIYKIRYDAWISPDSLILAWSEAGSVSGINVQNITMTSFGYPHQGHDDDAPLEIIEFDSFTNESCYSPDLSGGKSESMVFPRATATKLNTLHRDRLALFVPQPFSDDPMDDFHELRKQHAESVCQMGMGRFINAEESIWLPTLVGGVKMTAKLYAFMLARRAYPHRWRLRRRLKKAARVNAA